MSTELIILLMAFSMVVCLALGIPIAFSLGTVALAVNYFVFGPHSLITIVFSVFSQMWQILFMAVPLFIFMGAVLERSGITDRLYEAVYRSAGPIRGGLAIGTVTICVLFAAMTGLTGASTVTLALVALPSMLRRGYDKHLAIGSIAGGGTLAILIPPSVPMVLLALVTRQPVGKLLIAGILPGLLIAALFILYIVVKGITQPKSCPAHPETFTLKQKIVSFKVIVFPLFLIFAVLGSIFFGVATPTEAASLGAAGSLLCAGIERRFNWQLIRESCYATMKLTGIALWIGFGASCFSNTFSSAGGIEFISKMIAGLSLNRWMVFTVIALIILVLGCFIDAISIIMIAGTISFSTLIPLGFNGVWFGVIFVILLEMGYLTPPFGFNLFYIKSVAPPDVNMSDIIVGVIPFILIEAFAIVLLIIFPQVVLWLPNLMR